MKQCLPEEKLVAFVEKNWVVNVVGGCGGDVRFSEEALTFWCKTMIGRFIYDR